MTQWGFYLNIVTIQIIISKKEIVRCYYLGAHITSFIDETLILIMIGKFKKDISLLFINVRQKLRYLEKNGHFLCNKNFVKTFVS